MLAAKRRYSHRESALTHGDSLQRTDIDHAE
jgi:hypothetical protein